MEFEFNFNRLLFNFTEIALITPCLYNKIENQSFIQNEIYQVYTNSGLEILEGGKNITMNLLNNRPQEFVQFMAIYLLQFFAPRIKKGNYWREQDTRLILAFHLPEFSQVLINNNQKCNNGISDLMDQLSKLFIVGGSIKFNDLIHSMQKVKYRIRNTEKVYYKNFYLSKNSLKRIYVKNKEVGQKIETLLKIRNVFHVTITLI